MKEACDRGLSASREVHANIELYQLDDGSSPGRTANVLCELFRSAVDKNATGFLPFFARKAPQIALQLSNVFHPRLALLAFDYDCGPVAVFQQNIEPTAVTKDALTNLFVWVRKQSILEEMRVCTDVI